MAVVEKLVMRLESVLPLFREVQDAAFAHLASRDNDGAMRLCGAFEKVMEAARMTEGYLSTIKGGTVVGREYVNGEG